jgi:hypothetical protein
VITLRSRERHASVTLRAKSTEFFAALLPRLCRAFAAPPSVTSVRRFMDVCPTAIFQGFKASLKTRGAWFAQSINDVAFLMPFHQAAKLFYIEIFILACVDMIFGQPVSGLAFHAPFFSHFRHTITSTTQQQVSPRPTQQASRKIHTDSLENEQERARYMAEFHARPMEMDRKSGASAANMIRPSHESLHLFDNNSSKNNAFGGLHPRLISSLTKMGVTQPTIIQTRAIQALLSLQDDKMDDTISLYKVKREVERLQVRHYIDGCYCDAILSDGYYIWLRHDLP